MRLLNEQLMTAVAVSSTTTYTSTPMQLEFMVNYCIQAIITGTPVGTIGLQASNDEGIISYPNPGLASPVTSVTNWTDIANTSTAVTGAGTVMYNVQNCGYRWVRVSYTNASSSGTITVVGNGKGA